MLRSDLYKPSQTPWYAPLASKGTNPLLTLFHTTSIGMSFKGDKSFGGIRLKIGKRTATLKTYQAT